MAKTKTKMAPKPKKKKFTTFRTSALSEKLAEAGITPEELIRLRD